MIVHRSKGGGGEEANRVGHHPLALVASREQPLVLMSPQIANCRPRIALLESGKERERLKHPARLGFNVESEASTGHPGIWLHETEMSMGSKKFGLYKMTAQDPLASGFAHTSPPSL